MMKSFRNFAVGVGVVALAVCVFPAASAFAHDGGNNATAMEAAEVGDMATMQSFVLHAKRHVKESSSTLDGNSVLRRQQRLPGDWNSGSVYLIDLLESPTGATVRNHGKFIKTLYAADLSKLPTLKSLIEKLKASTDMEMAVCEQYGSDNKWACAVSYELEAGAGRYFLIGGFDHQENDPMIVKASCPKQLLDNAPKPNAADVQEKQDEETLKAFVQATMLPFRFLLQQGSGGLANLNVATKAILGCIYQEGPWKSGSVYLFGITNQGTVTFNANNYELTGTTFKGVFDEDGVDISKVIFDAAGADGKGGFVKYKWDDPAVDGDEVNEPNKSPGRSPKVTYVEGLAVPGSGLLNLIIVGAGYYPKDSAGTDMPKPDMPKTSSGDSGCAVAGAGADSGSFAFGLFLAVFSICFVIGMRSRRT